MRKNLIATRQDNQLTQTEVAKKIGTCVRNYQYLEAGTSNGRMTLWAKLSNLFEKPIDFLMKNN